MDDVIRGLPTIHVRAADKKVTPSTMLEVEQPTPSVEFDNGYDAFGRVLEHLGIVIRDSPAAGVYSTPSRNLLTGEHVTPEGTKIGREQGRAIAMILTERAWRRQKYGKSANTRSLFTSEEDALGSAARPWTDAADIRDALDREPAIALSNLIAKETAVESRDYRSIYVDETAVGTFDYMRVTEGAEIPTVNLRTGAHTIRLHKRGRAINWTYEAALDMRLDKMQMIIQKMAIDVEAGKIAQAVAVLLAGDGNGNAPTTIDLTDMDSSLTAGDPPSLRSWLRYRKAYRGAFALTTVLGNIEDIVTLEMVEVGLDSTPLAFAPASSGVGQLVSINNRRENNQIGVGDLEPGIIPPGILLGFDNRWALERVSQIGATISESESFISNQTNLLTFTDVDGFAMLYSDAVKPLDLEA